MDQRTVLIESLEKSRASMLTHLEEIDRDRKIYPLWTIREILAHICGWDDSVIAMARALLADSVPATPAMRGADVYNAETVSTREGLDYDHIYREYMQTRKTVLDLLRELPEEKIARPSVLPWGEPGSLVDLVHIFAEHEIEHAVDVQQLIAAGKAAQARD